MMPPKKSVANGDADDNGGPFKWEGANDAKLLLLTQGRWVKPDEYPQLSSAFPGTSTGSIRNRISALRVKQRNLYLELSWELPEGGAGHGAKKTVKNTVPRTTTPKKRAANDISEGDDGDVVKTPSKKPRARKGKGAGDKKEVVEDEDDYIPMAKRVKEEVLEEDI